jgi:hypothetical protein
MKATNEAQRAKRMRALLKNPPPGCRVAQPAKTLDQEAAPPPSMDELFKNLPSHVRDVTSEKPGTVFAIIGYPATKRPP